MNKYLFVFLLPIIAYLWVIVGFSVGEDCVMNVITPKVSNYFYCQQQVDTGAYVWQSIPEWKEVSRSYLAGKIPWWSSYSGLGAPLAANFISGAFNIPTVIANIDPTLLFSRWWMVLRLSVAAVGTYWLLSILGFSALPAIAGAALFVFNGYITQLFSILHHDVDIYLPWLVASVIKSQQNKKFVFIAGVFLGLSMLAGMPESTIFVWGAGILFSIYVSFRNRGGSKFVWLINPFLMTLVGLMIGAILIIPGLEFVRLGSTIRSTALFSTTAYYIDVRNFLTWVLPKIFGPYHNLISKDPSLNTYAINYWGFSASLLILLSIIKTRSKTGILLLFILLSYFGFIRIPWNLFPILKDVVITKYSLAVINLLAAIELAGGMSAWVKTEINYRIRIVSLVWLIIFVLILLFSKDLINIFGSNTGVKHLATIGFICLQLGLGIFLSWCLIRTRSLFTLCFFVVIELLIYLPWIGDRNWGYKIEQPEFVTWLQEHTSSQDRIFGLQGQIYPVWSSLYRLNDIRYIGPLWPKYYVSYLREFVQPKIDDAGLRFASLKDVSSQSEAMVHNNVFFDLLGVKYLISNQKEIDPNWKLVYSEGPYIYENETVIPRVSFVKETVCAKSDDEAIEMMKSNANRLRVVTIKTGTNCGRYSQGQIEKIYEMQNEIQIDYSLSSTGYIVISDNWYPGWEANVDGRMINVDRVNLTMRGVELPSGKHKLVMRYLPTFLRVYPIKILKGKMPVMKRLRKEIFDDTDLSLLAKTSLKLSNSLVVNNLVTGSWLDLLSGFRSKLQSSQIANQRISKFLSIDRKLDKNLVKNGIEIKEVTLKKDIPCKDKSFDNITIINGLEHLWNDQEILSECFRVLRKGGKLQVVVPTWFGKIFLEFFAFRLGWRQEKIEMNDHKRYYDEKSIWPMLVRAGFSPSEIKMKRIKMSCSLYISAIK